MCASMQHSLFECLDDLDENTREADRLERQLSALSYEASEQRCVRSHAVSLATAGYRHGPVFGLRRCSAVCLAVCGCRSSLTILVHAAERRVNECISSVAVHAREDVERCVADRVSRASLPLPSTALWLCRCGSRECSATPPSHRSLRGLGLCCPRLQRWKSVVDGGSGCG
jgi:hypothetical protein